MDRKARNPGLKVFKLLLGTGSGFLRLTESIGTRIALLNARSKYQFMSNHQSGYGRISVSRSTGEVKKSDHPGITFPPAEAKDLKVEGAFIFGKDIPKKLRYVRFVKPIGIRQQKKKMPPFKLKVEKQ